MIKFYDDGFKGCAIGKDAEKRGKGEEKGERKKLGGGGLSIVTFNTLFFSRIRFQSRIHDLRISFLESVFNIPPI